MGVKKFGSGEEARDWSRRIQDIMDEMRNRSFCDYRATGTWLPTVNIYETQAAYVLCVELAGLELDSVSVECTDSQHVTIAGQRLRPRAPSLSDPFSVELMEIDEGPFHREIDFSEPIAPDELEILYDTGYLWITLQKAGTQ
jgi:HSP20 family protein